MTVKDEVGNHAEYDKLRFPEFLEFLGRVAHAKFHELTGPLELKLDKVLFSVLRVKGLKFKYPEVKQSLDVDSSEESLDEFKAEEEPKSPLKKKDASPQKKKN